jgi:type 1 glutamine amidotransferase/regulation of enolase protein 1 (concanavalin A-like superfamily)
VRKVLVLVAAVFLLSAASAHAEENRVLVFSKAAAFRHDSIPQGLAAIDAIAAANGLTVDSTVDAGAFTAANLDRYKAVIWLSTSGDVLNDAQQNAFERYVHFGGGSVGIHAAAETEYGWPWYGELIGTWVFAHTPIRQETVDVVDRAHPSTRDLPATWTRTDAWYDFQRDPRSRAHVLATVGGHPVAWCRQFEGGRVWYTGMGHTAESYADPVLRRHLAGGILWAAGLAVGNCDVEPQPEPCEAGSDEFDGAAVDCRWSTIVRPNPSAYSVSDGALHITTERGDRNLFLQTAPSGDYELTAKVRLNASSGGQQAALLIYDDDDNYLRLGQVADGGSRWLEVVQELGGSPRHDATLDRLPLTGDYPSTFYLRLTQSGGKVIASGSPDGMNWRTVGRVGDVAGFHASKIGLAATTGDESFVTTADFDWFHLATSGGGEDTIAPAVTAAPEGLRTSNGRFLNVATVALSALDVGSGVDTLEYALDDAPFQPYTTPVTVAATGTVRYRATDKAGNPSSTGSVAVTIAAAPDCRPRAVEPGFEALYDGTLESLSDWSFAGSGGFEPDDRGECALRPWGGDGVLWYGKRLQPPYTIRAEWRTDSGDGRPGIVVGTPGAWKPIDVAPAVPDRWTVTEVEVDGAGFLGVRSDGADVSYRSIEVETAGPEPAPTPDADDAPGVRAEPPAALSLSFADPAAAFGLLVPGVAGDYDATLTATVTSGVRGATLSVRDAGAGDGKLANGRAKPETPLRVRVSPRGAFASLSGTPTTVGTFAGVAAGERVAIGLRQTVTAGEALRAGRYSKSLTFTLAAGTP